MKYTMKSVIKTFDYSGSKTKKISGICGHQRQKSKSEWITMFNLYITQMRKQALEIR